MQQAGFLFLDGKFSKTGKPLVSPDNRSFRYGDGLFETMKMVNGNILLEAYHFERLYESMELMKFKIPATFTPDYLREQASELAKRNGHQQLARIRLTVFRGEGGLYDVTDHYPHHLIQTWDLNPASNTLNENGLILGIYKDARKVCDRFSHIKNNNYLAYTMAAIWAKEQKLNDALLLNPYDRVADATIANVFIVTNGVIKTPAISEGCVSGVMRRHILQSLRSENMPVEETQLEMNDVLQASEIFLTNAIYGIKWVKQLGNSGYTNQLSSLLHKKMILPLL